MCVRERESNTKERKNEKSGNERQRHTGRMEQYSARERVVRSDRDRNIHRDTGIASNSVSVCVCV